MSSALRFLAYVLFGFLLAATPTTAAAQGGFGSFISPGPLARPHAELDSVTKCTECHAPGQGPTPSRCMVCHESIEVQVRQSSGFHGRENRGEECGSCHPDHRGRSHQLIVIPDDFSHLKETGFPLQGAHAELSCRRCHKTPGTYADESPECVSCHRSDEPHGLDATSRELLEACDSCHDAKDWDALPLPIGVFDHNDRSQADYALLGAHSDVDCAECHIDMVFVPIAAELCTDCHINPHRAPFREKPCEDCHATTETFFVDDFNHSLTGYPHEGQHRGVECTKCHTSGNKTEPMSRRCESCHADPHRGQFRPKDCDECHSVEIAEFKMRDFDHDTTEFPLVGQHGEVTCEECHGDGQSAVYVGLDFADCDSCHEDPHDGRHEPTDCARCHIEDGFEVQFFDHDTTSFPHTGSHVGLECEKCHEPGQWNGIPHASCNDCHYPKNPHRDSIENDSCEDCHVTEAFTDISFDHLGSTGFDLDPSHSDEACTDCHQGVEHFEGLDTSCMACHHQDRPWGHYDGECGDCHQAADWYPGGLGGRDHAITGFPLRGSHSVLPCDSCHPEGRPRGQASPSCVSCHAADDPHRNLLGMACADCHGEMSWLRTTFRHHQTGWPLRGAHRLAACIDCHALSYVGTPTDCFRCHEAEAPPQIPAHQSPDFQNCDRCHRVYQWSPAIFPH
ncbi:MAG: hypothetical protein KTR31_23660 [Myxococcales bacterium]|nr:hypothetical protein [Myxococcales bacterium]